MEEFLAKIMDRMEQDYDFDVHAGRKLYAYLYDEGFKDMEMDLLAHHLIYGEVRNSDAYNWMKKIEVAASLAPDIFNDYSGGYEAFLSDFKKFFYHPRRFTYTPLILCKGKAPLSEK